MRRSLFNFQNCSEVCNNTGQHQVSFIPVSILWSHSGFCWIKFNDKTPNFHEQGWRKGPESPQQREKHGDTFCHLSGQSPWSCGVTAASLEDKVRRVSMLSYLFTDSASLWTHHGQKTRCESPSLLRNVPLCLHFAWLDLPASLTAPFPFSLPSTAEICPALGRFAPDHIYLVRYHYHLSIFGGIIKAWRGFIPLTDLRGFFILLWF